MKVCANCGREISTRDGDNLCQLCDEANDKTALRRERARRRRRETDDILRSMGLTKVRGALGGVYWE